MCYSQIIRGLCAEIVSLRFVVLVFGRVFDVTKLPRGYGVADSINAEVIVSQ